MTTDQPSSAALARAAKRHRSQALEADALHFSTDVWSSAVVIAGLVCVWLSGRLGLPWLAKADAVSALGVAAIVVVIGIRLGKRSVDDLLDAPPDGLVAHIARASVVAAVQGVTQVRVRRSGPRTFADVVLQVERGLSIEAAHEIAHAAERAIRAAVEDVDVVVHTEPGGERDAGEDARSAAGP